MGPAGPQIIGKSQELVFFTGHPVRVRFDNCLFDPESRRLFRDGVAVPLSPKAFGLLEILVRNRPRAMDKSELQEMLWPDTFVVEANLANLVAELREAMGAKGRRDGALRTVHGFGYAFSADAVEETEARRAGASAFALVRDGRAFPLAEGGNVIGRDPDCAVFVDDGTVSRRHARVTVREGEALLEDLASKNGTTVNGRPPEGPCILRHGDAVLAGSVLFTVRVARPGRETETLAAGDGVPANAPRT
jgi:DNA-binding winged helix-turn-helix (wHTH) protein